MEYRKDEPPPYSATQSETPQNQYQYPTQTNYGFSTAQQPTDFGTAPPSNIVVSQVSSVGVSSIYSTPPQDYTTQAWLACLCCFWPTGLMAIMRANESREAAARGDMIGAHTAANSARQMIRISWVLGIIGVVFAVVIVVVYVVVLNNALDDDPYN